MLPRIVHAVERVFDRVKYRSGGLIRSDASTVIFPYMGYGTNYFIYLKGRVLEDTGIKPSKETDRIWDNLLNMYRRFESDEVPNARILAKFRDIEQEIYADEEGFFEVPLRFEEPRSYESSWQKISLELLDPLKPDKGKVAAEGTVMIISPRANFGVISDIDDTVVHTGVTSRLKLASTILLRNAYTRLPLKGVANFYNALRRGSHGSSENPLFYVSSSPWNMYDLFWEFFQINEIPRGPIFLRDWGFERHSMLAKKSREYKLETIFSILDNLPDLNFLLIGDSGEEDPEIYTQVIQAYPQRILGVYIRDVRHNMKRMDEIQDLADQIASCGSMLVLAEDAHEMAAHAARQEWIGSGAASQPIK